ncbi:hypothetical protein RGQ29_015721 [Quercus rubra]|uniref:Uncharacterized protein n=1 Tax=Quercus rubra TaxID=3512 RepID=A0AAN7J3U1_QUERU|nr:hypothetical protein RGQ29_015721 [Quercus rubra]
MAKFANEATTVQRVLESLFCSFCYFDNGNLWSLEHGVALSVLLDTVNEREIWLSLCYLQLMMTFYPMHSKGQLILACSKAWKVQPY